MATAGDIQARVDEALKVDPMIDSHDIVVELFGDYVVLNGTVPSQAQSAEATAAAQRVDGVEAVRNLLAIALPSTDYGDDHALAQVVNQALADSLAAPGDVEVTVREGDVRLTGSVRTTAESIAAENCVTSCAGVLTVTNDIEILGDPPQL
jgi:osmotically-inducible protein OsmY